ncbi:MAG: cytochrome c [Deltaproteobacteria bacterium]|nr:cytochrome c [Deltaproteobacteria bacterium]
MTTTGRITAGLALALALGACGGGGFDKPLMLSGRQVEPQTLERGRDLYNRYCATCHGIDGKAQTATGRALDPKPRDFSAAHFKHKVAPGDGLPTDEELGRIIQNGVPGTGMPAWPNLDAKDLDAVIQYIKTFSPRWQEARASTPVGAPTRGTAAIDPVHRALLADVTDLTGAATNVLPAPHEAVSFRAAFAPSLARLGPAPSDER